MPRTAPHVLKASHTCKHILPKHTRSTYHCRIIAKHTTNYIWTVSLTDQTHVDSLTFNLSMYDYSSSSDCWVWVAKLPQQLVRWVASPFAFKSNEFFYGYLFKRVHFKHTHCFPVLHSHSYIQSCGSRPENNIGGLILCPQLHRFS